LVPRSDAKGIWGCYPQKNEKNMSHHRRMSGVKPNILKKILREITELNADANSNIYAHINSDDIQSLKVLVIGPSDSPYYGGFFLFSVGFPPDFPFSPPKVNFLTPKYRTGCRMHPNLYQEGRVCLSILNTWGKSEWSPALTLEKIFLTIQGLLDDNPLAHEPGQERYGRDSPEAVNYRMVALHRTLKTGVIDMFAHPDVPQFFLGKMVEFFRRNREKYLEQVEKLASNDGKYVACFHGDERIDYQALKNKLMNVFD